jgi:hypothetical protein
VVRGDNKRGIEGKMRKIRSFFFKEKHNTNTTLLLRVVWIKPFHCRRAPCSAFGSRCGGGAGRHTVEF